MTETLIVPDDVGHTINTANLAAPLSGVAISEINDGYRLGLETERDLSLSWQDAISADLEEEQAFHEQSPEAFLGFTVGLRGPRASFGRDIDTVRFTLAHGVHAAESVLAGQESAAKKQGVDRDTLPATDQTFFEIIRKEFKRLAEDDIPSARINSLEGLIGYSIGVRTFLLAKEAKRRVRT